MYGTNPAANGPAANGPAADYRQRITAQQAAEIAVARVPGQIIHVDMELDDHLLKYEVYVLTDQGVVYEVEIASRDGRVLSVERED
ncbi:PepSY domain-containing protein [Sporolactobacillus terrae]|uniref:Peptidase M4 n=1 Tax=Sporolactobacillus terrae TaxID=269673 RepID=A0ABX5Q3W4_9BACL|nr:PepSY domain-containing protein [Sporolactobacillus terrae]QAA21330.1 peptidase M4 [Sporolactobacillus terrae]QAA24302.1 peptidase M4 [Sporolactobacillus terrae]UAK18062.1 PepSY domain-containing protein [Sporolactobacillus terrae]